MRFTKAIGFENAFSGLWLGLFQIQRPDHINRYLVERKVASSSHVYCFGHRVTIQVHAPCGIALLFKCF